GGEKSTALLGGNRSRTHSQIISPFSGPANMRHFTQKQRAFIQAFIRCRNGYRAALEAGYAEPDARSRASKLLANTAVKKEVERLANIGKQGQPQRLPSQYDDPLNFLTSLMQDETVDLRLRLEAAKALLPFKHKKKAGVGTKEQRQELAREVAGRFAPRQPPLGTIVSIR
ncbi:terminase small subunit, partial [Pseudomonas aeruginosa]